MTLDIEAIEKRANSATPGPWTTEKPPKNADGWQTGCAIAATYGRQMIYATPPGGQAPSADRYFIAHAREDVPALIAEVKRLRAALEAVSIHGATLAAALRRASHGLCGMRGHANDCDCNGEGGDR